MGITAFGSLAMFAAIRLARRTLHDQDGLPVVWELAGMT
jgi:hypothetical protein